MLHLWIISHIKTPRDIFNNFGGWPSIIKDYYRWDLEELRRESMDREICRITRKQLQMENIMDELHNLYNELWKQDMGSSYWCN